MYVVGIFFLEDRVSSRDTLNSCPSLLQHKPEDTSMPDRLSELPCRHECISNYGIPHHTTSPSLAKTRAASMLLTKARYRSS